MDFPCVSQLQPSEPLKKDALELSAHGQEALRNLGIETILKTSTKSEGSALKSTGLTSTKNTQLYKSEKKIQLTDPNKMLSLQGRKLSVRKTSNRVVGGGKLTATSNVLPGDEHKPRSGKLGRLNLKKGDTAHDDQSFSRNANKTDTERSRSGGKPPKSRTPSPHQMPKIQNGGPDRPRSRSPDNRRQLTANRVSSLHKSMTEASPEQMPKSKNGGTDRHTSRSVENRSHQNNSRLSPFSHLQHGIPNSTASNKLCSETSKEDDSQNKRGRSRNKKVTVNRAGSPNRNIGDKNKRSKTNNAQDDTFAELNSDNNSVTSKSNPTTTTCNKSSVAGKHKSSPAESQSRSRHSPSSQHISPPARTLPKMDNSDNVSKTKSGTGGAAVTLKRHKNDQNEENITSEANAVNSRDKSTGKCKGSSRIWTPRCGSPSPNPLHRRGSSPLPTQHREPSKPSPSTPSEHASHLQKPSIKNVERNTSPATWASAHSPQNATESPRPPSPKVSKLRDSSPHISQQPDSHLSKQNHIQTTKEETLQTCIEKQPYPIETHGMNTPSEAITNDKHENESATGEQKLNDIFGHQVGDAQHSQTHEGSRNKPRSSRADIFRRSKSLPRKGIVNTGNSCYLNSALQFIFTVPSFAGFKTYQENIDVDMEGDCQISRPYERQFMKRMQKMAEQILISEDDDDEEETGACSIRRSFLSSYRNSLEFRECIGKDHVDFSGSGQEDASSYILHIISLTQKYWIGRSDENPINSVKLNMVETITSGGATENVDRIEYMIPLPIPEEKDPQKKSFRSSIWYYPKKQEVDLQERVNVFFSQTEIPVFSGGNIIERIIKKTDLKKLPPFVILHARRFIIDSWGHTKPTNMDIDSKTIESIELHTKNEETAVYTLEAIINHYGSTPKFGHYNCHVRDPSSQWLCLNDLYTTRLSVDDVPFQDAYLYLYKKKPISRKT